MKVGLPRKSTTPTASLPFHHWILNSSANMLSFVTQASLALLLAVPIVGQAAKAPNRFASEIPKAEAVALAGIVEDDSNSLASARKGGDDESPAYKLYSVELPIPPVAQVKQ